MYRYSGTYSWTALGRAAHARLPSSTIGWPPLLESGQRIELVQRLEDGALHFEVHYYGAGGSYAAATEAGLRIRRDLEFAIASAFSEYRFTHQDPERPRVRPEWTLTHEFLPEACRILVVPQPGFSANRSRFSQIRLPVMRARPVGDFLDALVPLVAASSDDLEIAVTLEGIAMPEDEVPVIAGALHSIYCPDRIQTDSGAPWSGDLGALTMGLSAYLVRWLEHRAGWSISLSVRARSTLSPTFLLSISASVLHGATGRWVIQSNPRELVSGDVLDIAQYWPVGWPAPAVSPPPDYYSSAGHLKLISPHPGMLSETGILLGRTNMPSRGDDVLFADADRTRHCYVVGATGTGKSTLLLNMALQDIRAGRGLCLLDPHGDLQQDLVRALPAHRADDIIPIDLADAGRAIGINLLDAQRGRTHRQISFGINELLSIFWMLYGSIPESMGPAFEQYMRNTLMVLAHNATGPWCVADVMRFYEDPGFRRAILESCTNPGAAAFFKNIASKTTGEHSFENFAPYITNKLGRFVGSDFVRPVISQPTSTIDFRSCMDEGKVLLINLNKGVLGEMEVKLVGMLILGKLFSDALGRADECRSKRRAFHIYVDEAQNFVTPVVGSMLAESRKFGLSVTLANQNLSQWDGGPGSGLLNTILGNVGTFLMFRLGPQDASRLSVFVEPEFSARDLQYLPDRLAVAKLLSQGRPVPPFSMQTVVPPDLETEGVADEVLKARLRRNFEMCSRDREEIEAAWEAGHEAALRQIGSGAPSR